MPELVRHAAALVAVALLLTTSSCSNQTAPPAAATMSEFSDVVARLTQVATERSVDGTTISLVNTTEEPGGKRSVTARRVTPQSTTEYTMRFHKPAERWLCEGADMYEQGNSGAKSEAHINSSAMEIEQLISWLKW